MREGSRKNMARPFSRIGMDDGKSLEYLQSINMVPEVTDPYGYMEKRGMMVTRLTPEQMQNFTRQPKKFVTNGPKKLAPILSRPPRTTWPPQENNQPGFCTGRAM